MQVVLHGIAHSVRCWTVAKKYASTTAGDVQLKRGHSHRARQSVLCMQEIMKDPVVASDGITYERQSIQEWMQSSDISPWDNQPFETKDLTPNSLVLNFISQFGLA